MLANNRWVLSELSCASRYFHTPRSHLSRPRAVHFYWLLRPMGQKVLGCKNTTVFDENSKFISFSYTRNTAYKKSILSKMQFICVYWTYSLLSHFQTHLTYEMERLNIEALSNGHITMPATKTTKYSHDDFDGYPKYPIELLRSEASRLPDSIDPKMKELHLTHDDFVSIFHMNYTEFAGLPNWKKQELKKIQKLF